MAMYRPPVQVVVIRGLLLNKCSILQVAVIYHGPGTCLYFYPAVLLTARICIDPKPHPATQQIRGGL